MVSTQRNKKLVTVSVDGWVYKEIFKDKAAKSNLSSWLQELAIKDHFNEKNFKSPFQDDGLGVKPLAEKTANLVIAAIEKTQALKDKPNKRLLSHEKSPYLMPGHELVRLSIKSLLFEPQRSAARGF